MRQSLLDRHDATWIKSQFVECWILYDVVHMIMMSWEYNPRWEIDLLDKCAHHGHTLRHTKNIKIICTKRMATYMRKSNVFGEDYGRDRPHM